MPFLCFPFPFRILFFLFICPFSFSTHSLYDDGKSLLAFKKHITSDPHASMADWSPAVPFCNWTAVTCSHRHLHKVISLNLTSRDLHGPISPSLANLTFLHTLVLSGNLLHGYIPPQLGSLFRLKTLWLNDNQLGGNIPNELSNCTNLVSLALSYNTLTGSIPLELGSLTHLQKLYLGSNILTGNIPNSLSNISILTTLAIYENKLTGSIPQELGRLTSLRGLYLYENELSGIIPASLSNLSALTDLEISINTLTGSIPQELGLLTSLQTLYLDENELSGTIPASLSNISTLTGLDISINTLTGSIPTSFSNLFNLTIFQLWGNQLSGTIPNSIGNCSKLRELALSDNKLSGSVPVQLGKLSLLEKLYLNVNQLGSGNSTTMSFLIALTNCSHLKVLNIRNNKLAGVLPLHIGKLSTNLSVLTLANNMIEGRIPPHIGNLSSLTYLNLSGNLLNGSIPSLRNLTNLERLDLGNNKLEGNIPDDFEQLQRLGLLDISGNLLSGKIPNSLASLKQLRDLLLHNNRLSGSIPSNLGSCTNLELLDLSHNILTGSIPREIAELHNLQFYLNLSWNLLEGSLPLEIGKITMAQAIDVSANHLTGAIPSTIGSCVELFSLNLSQNSFQGSIPDSLENLKSLMSLDLSSNSLSGIIPPTLNKLEMLQYLNLSFNKLTGEIPRGGPFANLSISISLNGNPNLCGPQVFQLSSCPTPRGHPTIVKRVLFPVSGVVAFILCCFLLIFLWRRNMHIQNIYVSRAIFQKFGRQRISYQELHRATDGFSEANLLGTGSFGLVYKGVLTDGTLVAVKVLSLQSDQGLVFEFMPNGSLEKHLYPNIHNNNLEVVCELGLRARLDIAINVAHAIKYLHHDSFVQVVHCDIKPSNVLLDEDMVAHVTDFGIAKLIGESSTGSLSSTLALRGSMGYIAPEYGLGVVVSSQGDVYSYGILLLEILTRKQPTSGMFIGDLNLHSWVNLAFPDRVKEVIDNDLFIEVGGDDFEENKVYKCLVYLLHVGLLCSKHSPNERPTMKFVLTALESIKEDLVENSITSRGLRRSISNLLSSLNTASNDAPILNDQSSSTY
eukprot:PITA_12679